jgi:hypothetical protein
MQFVLKILSPLFGFIKPYIKYILVYGSLIAVGYFVAYNGNRNKIKEQKTYYDKKVYNLLKEQEELVKDTTFFSRLVEDYQKREKEYLGRLSQCNNITIGKVKTKDGVSIIDIKQDSVRRKGLFSRIFKRRKNK